MPYHQPRTFEEYCEELETVLPIIEAEAETSEQLCYLSDRTVATLQDAGLYRMLLPRELAGAELTHLEAMKIIERLAWAHGSTGWCAMVNNSLATAMALYAPGDAVGEIFAENPDVMVAGNGIPRGFARPVDGGYMIRGNWAYGSGIQHAEWVHSGCIVLRDEKISKLPNGQTEILIAHHPRDSVELRGNWDVLGLRATGSFDYGLKDAEELFVPEGMCYRSDSVVPCRGGIQGSLGLVGIAAWAHSSWALGVGRRMLDELVLYAREKADVFGKVCDAPTFRFQFAQAEAKFRSARSFLVESWQSIADGLAAGQPATVRQITSAKLGMRHIHDVVSEVGTFAYRTARGTSLHDGLMQRVYRDIHSGTQHIHLADQVVQECGRDLLGLVGPTAKWVAFNIVD
ncbi:acyl-CoA dehydrogenase [Tardibacter chloracetimidivorans]|uniref:Acyl-CoA dehydrogenase n=1 Tax=Tardibacter chloracetimidivorans TaxID=1921510 RepID=A0A1L3ZVT8_9SPHN|nr:acyl-CoA dehydrogenase family protein [Tardibacter chloracetimidivorans]API59764.1 acyl-CoA dehydrogenase [Tardibacter chloracetimidivorans]